MQTQALQPAIQTSSASSTPCLQLVVATLRRCHKSVQARLRRPSSSLSLPDGMMPASHPLSLLQSSGRSLPSLQQRCWVLPLQPRQ